MVFKKVKYSLSHLSKNAWHRKLVNFAYFDTVKPKKACMYWWLIVPAALPLAGLIGVAVLVLGLGSFVIANVCYLISWFFGYRTKDGYIATILKFGWLEEPNSNLMEYKVHKAKNHPGLTKSRFAPYHFAMAICGIAGMVWLVTSITTGDPALWTVLTWTLRVALVIIALSLVGLLYKKFLYPRISAACPAITWESE